MDRVHQGWRPSATALDQTQADGRNSVAPHEACGLLRQACTRLRHTGIESIIEHGLHQFIGEFIASNQRIAHAVAADYRFVE